MRQMSLTLSCHRRYKFDRHYHTVLMEKSSTISLTINKNFASSFIITFQLFVSFIMMKQNLYAKTTFFNISKTLFFIALTKHHIKATIFFLISSQSCLFISVIVFMETIPYDVAGAYLIAKGELWYIHIGYFSLLFTLPCRIQTILGERLLDFIPSS